MTAFKQTPTRVKVAWVGLCLSLVAWPVSQLTFAKNEPFLTLALSWLAICLVCVDILINTKQSAKEDE